MAVEKKEYRIFGFYTLIVALISSFLWAFAEAYAMPIIMVLCALSLLIKNDLKYGLPFIVDFIFVNGELAATADINIGLIIGTVLLLITLIVFWIRNRIKPKVGQFGVNFMVLAILGMLPLLWNRPTTTTFYFLYFAWAAYFFVYIFCFSSLKMDIKEEFSYVMEGLLLLLSLECMLSVGRLIELKANLREIYSLGWGICNEAGIMLCVSVPFVFYLFYDRIRIKNKEWIVHFLVLLFGIGGIMATLSRGTILFAGIEFVILILYSMIHAKLYKTTAVLCIFGFFICLFLMVWKFDFFMNHLMDIIDDNGRFELYDKALAIIRRSPLYFLFGAGFAFDVDYKGAVFVCHSTIYETLASMGIIGLAVILWHFALKYKLVLKNGDYFNRIMFIGFVVVDIYGLIDNTYHMYYYMIVLALILAVVERANREVEI